MKRLISIILVVIFCGPLFAQNTAEADRYLRTILTDFPEFSRQELDYHFLDAPISIDKTAKLIRSSLKSKTGNRAVAFISADTDALSLAFRKALKRIPKDKPVPYQAVIISVSVDHYQSLVGHILNWQIPIQAFAVAEETVFELRARKADYLLNETGDIPRDQVTYLMQHYEKGKQSYSAGATPLGGSVSTRTEYDVRAYVTAVNGVAVKYGKNKTPIPAGLNLVAINCWNGSDYIEVQKVHFFDPETQYQIGYALRLNGCAVNLWKWVK